MEIYRFSKLVANQNVQLLIDIEVLVWNKSVDKQYKILYIVHVRNLKELIRNKPGVLSYIACVCSIDQLSDGSSTRVHNLKKKKLLNLKFNKHNF